MQKGSQNLQTKLKKRSLNSKIHTDRKIIERFKFKQTKILNPQIQTDSLLNLDTRIEKSLNPQTLTPIIPDRYVIGLLGPEKEANEPKCLDR